jgi:hypothetical protein
MDNLFQDLAALKKLLIAQTIGIWVVAALLYFGWRKK